MLNNFDQSFDGIGIRIDIVDICFDRSISGIHHCLEERLVCVPPGLRMAIGNARQTSSDQNIFFKPRFCNLLSRQCYHWHKRESLKVTFLIMKSLVNNFDFVCPSWKFWKSFPNLIFAVWCQWIKCKVSSPGFISSFEFSSFQILLFPSCMHHLNEAQSPKSEFPKKFENTCQQIQVLSLPWSSSSSSS